LQKSNIENDVSNICDKARIEESSGEEDNTEFFGFNELAQEIQKIQVDEHKREEIFQEFEELFETHSVKFANPVLDLDKEKQVKHKMKPLGSEVLGDNVKRKPHPSKADPPSFSDLSMIHGQNNKWK
jgi:hypothetical protein